MSNNAPRRPRKGEPRAAASDRQSTDRPQGTGYEVGYGKPPKDTRFVKGRSGNPRGRPRKPKPQPPKLSDALSDKFLEDEAYRSIALRENGRGIELPAVQAVLRAVVASAIKGNRLSQKYFLEYVAGKEEQQFQLKMQNYVRLQALKDDGERALAEHRRKGLPPPDLLPHPEDIVLNPATGEACVNGPETQEDVHFYEHSVQLRDHVLLRSAHAYELRRKASAKLKDDAICAYLLWAQVLDSLLPRRYRWKNNAELHLLMEFQYLSKREREQRIAVERARLIETKPRLSLVTPEIELEIDRIYRKFSAMRENHPN